DRARDLAGAHQRTGEVVDLLMHRIEEVRGLEEVRDAIERLVVDEDGAQQRLLDLDVARRGTARRLVPIADEQAIRQPCLPGDCWYPMNNGHTRLNNAQRTRPVRDDLTSPGRAHHGTRDDCPR